MDEWYYKREDSEFGPISETELRALLEREKNAAEIQIRRNTQEDWAAAETALPVPPRPASVPPPIPRQPCLTAPGTRFTGPTLWLWFSALMLALDLIVLGFMQFVFSVYALFLLAGITGLPDWFIQCVNVLDSRVHWPQAAMFVLIILWQGCAFGSILRLYGDGRIKHGRRSGFWWITPFANLFMPFQCLRELRWASRQKRTASESGISAGALLWMVQVVIVFKILAAIADKLVRGAGTAVDDGSLIPTAVNLAINIFGLALGFLMTVFVLRNLVHQIRLYRGWNTPAAAH